MQHTRYLHINSKNRSYGYSYDFAIELKLAIMSVKSVKLLALALPLSNYTINDSNNIIYFTDGVTDFEATIIPGIYNSDNIGLAIKNAMESVGYVGTISTYFSENTYTLTIISTTNFSLQFGTFMANSAYQILGFDLVDTSLDIAHEGDNAINLSIPPCIFIKINEFPIMCRSSNGINGTFPIYINTISGEINYFYSNLYFENKANNTISFTNMLHIQLIDPDTGDLFDVNDNEISILLELEY
jgi:hypothetical protein